MNRINIAITGIAGAGKTGLAHKIAALLQSEGVDVELYDECRPFLDEGVRIEPDSSCGDLNLPMKLRISVVAS